MLVRGNKLKFICAEAVRSHEERPVSEMARILLISGSRRDKAPSGRNENVK